MNEMSGSNYSLQWSIEHLQSTGTYIIIRQTASKFSALNADFSTPSPDRLSLRRPAQASVKER